MKNVLLVMHSYPSNSSFLMNKFLRLEKHFKIKLLVWSKASKVGNNVYTGLTDLSVVALLITGLQALTTFVSKPKQSLLFCRKLGIKKFFKGHYFIRKYFDVIHFEFGTLAIEWMKLKTVCKSRIVVSFRGYDLNYFKLGNDETYSAVWQNADAFHFLGRDLYNRALKRGYSSNKANFFISPAIDLNLFKPNENKTYLSNGVLQLVSVGRLVWKKGIEYGLKAVQLLDQKGIPVHYTIIGDGENKQAIEFCIRELDLTHCVTMTYHLNQPKTVEILKSMDLFLHPAISEGFCNAVVEAQAMKLPVVCTTADGLQENIEEGKTGFAVDIYDALKLANQIEYFFNNKIKLSEFGECGRKRAEEHYKIEDQIDKFVKLYNEVSE
jgi:colanic acid/amylovoran biosynthesis glycosyltransferase